jgi:hypothetical protein
VSLMLFPYFEGSGNPIVSIFFAFFCTDLIIAKIYANYAGDAYKEFGN